jgi:hypothetical protein
VGREEGLRFGDGTLKLREEGLGEGLRRFREGVSLTAGKRTREENAPLEHNWWNAPLRSKRILPPSFSAVER